MHVDMMDLSGDDSPRCRVMVLGIGGGGCSAVQHMEAGWTHGPLCVGIDTDAQVMAQTTLSHRLQIGRELTQGQGAGGDPTVGKLAAEDDEDAIRDLLGEVDLLFLIVALGGGTGTGAAPVVVRLARDQGATVLCFATLPFSFEGEERRHQAQLGLRDLRLIADAVVVQPNDRLLESTSEAEALVEAFAASDMMVGVGIRALWKVLTEPGVLNVSFEDLRQLIRCSGGTCAFGFATGHGEHRAEQAVQELMTSPLLDRGAQIAKAEALLVNLCGGRDVTMLEIQEVMDQVRSLAKEQVRLLLGYCLDPAMEGRLSITILAAESWAVAEAPPREQEAAAAPTAEASDGAAAPRPRGGGKSRVDLKRREVQARMADTKDRFSVAGVAPSFHDGEDLDVPTFIRRNVKLSARY